jgi:hypothetical protein
MAGQGRGSRAAESLITAFPEQDICHTAEERLADELSLASGVGFRGGVTGEEGGKREKPATGANSQIRGNLSPCHQKPWELTVVFSAWKFLT